MKPKLKLYMVFILILAIINDTMARRKKAFRRNRTSILKDGRREWLIESTSSTTTTTEIPMEFPFGMVCISRKSHRSLALKVTEECCHRIGVACKQTDHIGHPQERNCVAENRRQFKNMKTCCRKRKKTWKKGHVEDGIDCNHRMENVTEPTEATPEPTSTLPPTTSELPTTTTTIPTTTSKPHPKPVIVHHVKTSRPQHVTNKLHHHFTTTTKATTTTTTTRTTTTTKTTKKPKELPKPDVKRKVLKMKN